MDFPSQPAAAYLGLIGVALGWILKELSDRIRRWEDRKEKTRELTINRGEELLQQLVALFEWAEEARKTAFKGDIYVPVQNPAFHFAAIVEIFYPSLSPKARELDAKVTNYRNILVDVAANKMTGKPMTDALNGRLAAAAEGLPVAIAMMISDARDAVRIHLSDGASRPR
jgi:hypothetical protein